MWRAYFVKNRTDFAVTNTFIDLLKGKIGNFPVDPRLYKFSSPKVASIDDVKNNTYKSSTNLNDYEGMPYGITSGMASEVFTSGTISFPSYDVLHVDRGEVLMEYAEVEFILSELNNWDDVHYQNGVIASLDKWGVSTQDQADFLNKLPSANEENVLTQKYIALYMQPHEAWAEYRRTGFPKTLLLPKHSHTLPAYNKNPAGTTYTFEPLVNDMYDLPTRIPYPSHLSTQNTKNYNEAVKNLGGPDNMKTKLIWDVN